MALVHDWLTGMRGGEWCLMAFLALYPDADVFSLLHVPGVTTPTIDKSIRGTSFLQHFPGVRKYYRYLLPFYPAAAKSIPLDGYDLVISLSHAAAKNVTVPRSTYHVCYCFTPMRYIWDQAEQYFGRFANVFAPLGRRLQEWDVEGSKRVNDFVAISRFVSARIRRIYGRRSVVIHPPVESGWIRGEPGETSDDSSLLLGDDCEPAFLCAGALVPYKRLDVVIKAFREFNEKVWVVGDGPQRQELEKQASKNVRFFGKVSDGTLAGFMRRSRALLFPGVEDFGMIPVEAMAAGKMVIGIDRGGLRDTVLGMRPWSQSYIAAKASTGVFIPYKHYGRADSLLSAVQFFSRHEREFSSDCAVQRAQLFSPARFFEQWKAFASERGFSERSGTRSEEPRIMRNVVNGRF